MKLMVLVVLVLSATSNFAQETIIAQPEPISSFKVGSGPEQVSYRNTMEGFESPGSPFVDSDGRIVFYNALNGKVFLIYYRGKVSHLPYRGNIDGLRDAGSRRIASQQGMLLDGLVQMLFDGHRIIEYSFSEKGIELGASDLYNYPAPFGALVYSDHGGVAVAFDVKHPKEQFEVIDGDRLTELLRTQVGGIGFFLNGLLYGGVWSVVRPTDTSEGSNYVGRLMSGHMVWMGVHGMQERYIVISNPQRKTELKVVLPWGGNNNGSLYMYDSGIGPWGELYCLLPPTFVVTGETSMAEGRKVPVYEPDPHGIANLVVVRNYLRYFGRLNDSGVRLRKSPSKEGEIVGVFEKKTGFRIIEKSTIEETIDGHRNAWYKVRLLDGTEGWFFGFFVSNLYDGPGTPLPWPNVPDW